MARESEGACPTRRRSASTGGLSPLSSGPDRTTVTVSRASVTNRPGRWSRAHVDVDDLPGLEWCSAVVSIEVSTPPAARSEGNVEANRSRPGAELR